MPGTLNGSALTDMQLVPSLCQLTKQRRALFLGRRPCRAHDVPILAFPVLAYMLIADHMPRVSIAVEQDRDDVAAVFAGVRSEYDARGRRWFGLRRRRTARAVHAVKRMRRYPVTDKALITLRTLAVLRLLLLSSILPDQGTQGHYLRRYPE